MSFRNSVNESIILPTSDRILGHNIKQQLKFLADSQWWSKDRLVEFQNKKLRDLIHHSYINVPYYTEVMNERGLSPNDIQNINDLRKLPILTKEDFKKNYPEKLLAQNWRTYKTLKRSSSGSTGQPIQYMMTREGYGFNKACYIRGWNWMGYRLGDKTIKISQNKRGTIEKRIQDYVNNTILFSSTYSKDNIDSFVSLINRIKPLFLRSYPDPLSFIAFSLAKYGNNIHPPQAINTTGNMLFPEIRSLVEERFDTKIFDSYSCEGGPNFFECDTHQCYHSSMEYGISEILDGNMNDVEIDQMGRLYTTDLWNYTSPFIRYDSADFVRKGGQCSCGRNLLTIKEVVGRDNDVIIAPNGTFLIAQTFTTYFKHISSILQFQIYQEFPNSIEIRLVVNQQSITNQILNEIYKYWDTYLNHSMDIKINLMDSIPLSPSGKRRFLIRNNLIPFNF